MSYDKVQIEFVEGSSVYELQEKVNKSIREIKPEQVLKIEFNKEPSVEHSAWIIYR